MKETPMHAGFDARKRKRIHFAISCLALLLMFPCLLVLALFYHLRDRLSLLEGVSPAALGSAMYVVSYPAWDDPMMALFIRDQQKHGGKPFQVGGPVYLTQLYGAVWSKDGSIIATRYSDTHGRQTGRFIWAYDFRTHTEVRAPTKVFKIKPNGLHFQDPTLNEQSTFIMARLRERGGPGQSCLDPYQGVSRALGWWESRQYDIYGNFGNVDVHSR